MKHKFTFTGVDCPVCASKLATMISEREGIDDAKINFLTEKLTVESELDTDAVYALVCGAAREFSKDVVIEKK